jgi:hypothetical protein
MNEAALWALAIAAILATWAISAMGVRVRAALAIVLCLLTFGLGFYGLVLALQKQEQHQRSTTDDLSARLQ